VQSKKSAVVPFAACPKECRIAFSVSLQLRAIGYRQKFLSLLAGKPFTQPSSLLPHVWDVSEIVSFFTPDHSVAPGFAEQTRRFILQRSFYQGTLQETERHVR
jgi:hypothetical protein